MKPITTIISVASAVAFLSSAAADVTVVEPWSTSVWRPGQKPTITWNSTPESADLNCDIQLMTGDTTNGKIISDLTGDQSPVKCSAGTFTTTELGTYPKGDYWIRIGQAGTNNWSYSSKFGFDGVTGSSGNAGSTSGAPGNTTGNGGSSSGSPGGTTGTPGGTTGTPSGTTGNGGSTSGTPGNTTGGKPGNTTGGNAGGTTGTPGGTTGGKPGDTTGGNTGGTTGGSISGGKSGTHSNARKVGNEKEASEASVGQAHVWLAAGSIISAFVLNAMV